MGVLELFGDRVLGAVDQTADCVADELVEGLVNLVVVDGFWRRKGVFIVSAT